MYIGSSKVGLQACKSFLASKFNFPVLVSKAYVEQVLPEVILGQTWLVDQAAAVRLQRQSRPYLEQVWVDEALDKLNHPP